MKLKHKITLYYLGVSLSILTPLIAYYSYRLANLSKRQYIEEANAYNQKSALMITSYFHQFLEKVKTVADMFPALNSFNETSHREVIATIQKELLNSNHDAAAFWYNRQLSIIDPKWSKANGRFEVKYYRAGSNLIYKENYTDKEVEGEEYKNIRLRNTEVIYEPYIGSYTGQKEDENMFINVAVPIQKLGSFIGLVGVDFTLDRIADYLNGIVPYNEAFSILVHSKGKIIYHPNPDLRTKSFSQFMKSGTIDPNFINYFEKGDAFQGDFADGNGKKFYCSFIAIKPANCNDYLYFGLFIPYNIILFETQQILKYTVILSLLGIITLIALLILIGNNLSKPIEIVTRTLERISMGETSNDLKLTLKSSEEINIMNNALNVCIDGLNSKTLFANSIGLGQLDCNLNLLSDDDILGKSLISMQQNLITSKNEASDRAIEDEKRTWINTGYALFADTLRQNNDNIQKLTDEVLKNIVKYVDANQGAMFVIEDDNNKKSVLKGYSVYAWDRKKYVNSNFLLGEGLIGACALEGETIFLTEIPTDFITISSGLGEANPNCIALIPLKHNSQVVGVLEIASFSMLEFHQIEFLEKISESIASTILSVKSNIQTKTLLEQSQQQAEEMIAQEEELRQNIEELQATKEEMDRKEKDINELISTYNSLVMFCEYDFNGKIINANNLFCQQYGYLKEELIGKHHTFLIQNTTINSIEYSDLFMKLMKNEDLAGSIRRKSRENSSVITKGIIRPIFNENNQPVKIIELLVSIN